MVGEARKHAVLSQITGGRSYASAGKALARIGNTTVHYRYVSKSAKGSARYAYNINPNTLRADYELWTCGDSDGWYLLPISVIRDMYEDPDAYVDNRHPEIRVVSVDVASDYATYGAGGKGISVRQYRDAVLP